MTRPDKPISPLRARMLEDLTLRKFAPTTQANYIRAVENLSAFIKHSPATASAEELRQFQLDMVKRGVSRITLNATITQVALFLQDHRQRSRTHETDELRARGAQAAGDLEC